MKTIPSVALIVPTYNMVSSLKAFLQSLIESGVESSFNELVFINDGSTDQTLKILEDFKITHRLHNKMMIINFPKNQGRYQARLQGSLAAHSTHLLFLDTRVEVGNDFASALENLKNKFEIIQGTITIPIDESIYSLYWDRSHRFLFNKNFKDQVNGFWLTFENYEKYTAGTGIFYCNRDYFLRACKSFTADPLSDDRALIKKITEIDKIWVTQELNVTWRPRQTLISFLERLWDRGPSFVSYHVYGQGSGMKKAVLLGGFLLLFNLIYLLINPIHGLMFVAVEFLMMLLSVLVFTRDPIEVIKLSWLHLLVILVFGLGVLRGLYLEFPLLKTRESA